MTILRIQNIYHQATAHIQSNSNAIRYSADILYFTIKGQKSSLIAGISGILYCALSYYEYSNIRKIMQEWYSYRAIFSEFAGNTPKTAVCSLPAMGLKSHPSGICPKIQGNLYGELVRGKTAAIKYTALLFFKPLLLETCKGILIYSLRKNLIKSWLSEHNNQIGLQLVDPEISSQAREIIDDYSKRTIDSILECINVCIDIILAIRKAYDMYYMTHNLVSEELDFNLVNFIALAIGIYFVVNILLNIVVKKYTESALQKQSAFNSDIIFNMNNGLQTTCNQASRYECNSLHVLLAEATKAQAMQTLLNASIGNLGIIFNNLLNFHILIFAMPSIIKNPMVYFTLEQIQPFTSGFGFSLWQIFSRILLLSSLPFSLTKVKRFIDSIYQYQTLLLKNRENFTIRRNLKADLYCNLTICYPNLNNSRSSGILSTMPFQHTFIPGKIYAISGPNGSGKSSFLNALFGIHPYAKGEVTITTQENIIYVPQHPIFKPHCSWKQTIFYPLDENAHNDLDLAQKILNWAKVLKLDDIYMQLQTESRMLSKLSGGEAQKLFLIQALAKIYLRRKNSDADSRIVLLLDESISEIDTQSRQITYELITAEVKAYNITAIHIDHSDKNILEARYERDCIIYF